VNPDHGLAHLEAISPRRLRIIDLLYTVDLQEVIAGAQSAHLIQAPLASASAECTCAGVGKLSAILRAFEVLGHAIALRNRPGCTLMKHTLELRRGELQRAGGANPTGHVLVERCHQPIHVGSQSLCLNAGAQQPHAAVDVIADSAGGHHTADGKAIALMHVWHRQRMLHDPR